MSKLKVNEIESLSGGAISILSEFSFAEDVVFAGDVTIAGDLVLGDADTDSVTFGADISSNLRPDSDNTYDFGSATHKWNNIHTNNSSSQTITLGGTLIVATPDEINYLSGTTSSIQVQITSNAADIGTNAADIATNVTDIGTNTADIATNVTDIGTNTADIATNASDIGTNTADIATNVTDIGTNAADIATNVTDIGTNTADIATNASDIGTNTADIATNASDIGTNTAGIATNASDIGTNTADIATNVTDIGTNAADIALRAPLASPTFVGSVSFGGSLNFAISTVTSDESLGNAAYTTLVDTTAGDVTLTLPDATTCEGRVYNAKKIAGGNDLILASIAGAIDGSATKTVSNLWVSVTAQSDGSNWYII